MNHRKFNSYMPTVNEAWAALILNMTHNPGNGPDLLGEKTNCEVKFTLLDSQGKYPVAWTVQEHQMGYDKDKPAHWGLGTYTMSVPVRSIRTTNEQVLESLVSSRELFIVPWDWMNRYTSSIVSGKTARSEWVNTFRYPKKVDLPPIISQHKVYKGMIYLTKGVDPTHFNIDTSAHPKTRKVAIPI